MHTIREFKLQDNLTFIYYSFCLEVLMDKYHVYLLSRFQCNPIFFLGNRSRILHSVGNGYVNRQIELGLRRYQENKWTNGSHHRLVLTRETVKTRKLWTSWYMTPQRWMEFSHIECKIITHHWEWKMMITQWCELIRVKNLNHWMPSQWSKFWALVARSERFELYCRWGREWTLLRSPMIEWNSRLILFSFQWLSNS